MEVDCNGCVLEQRRRVHAHPGHVVQGLDQRVRLRRHRLLLQVLIDRVCCV